MVAGRSRDPLAFALDLMQGLVAPRRLARWRAAPEFVKAPGATGRDQTPLVTALGTSFAMPVICIWSFTPSPVVWTPGRGIGGGPMPRN
jgi:hypothetical protein